MSSASISIVTPPGWWDLPLEPASRRQDISRLVEDRGATALSISERTALADVLVQAAEAAAAGGALLASQFGLVEGAAGFSASLLAAVHPGRVGPDTVGRALPDETALEIEEVELPAGPALRRRSRRRLAGGEYLQVQYFVRVGGDMTVVISGSCVGVDDPALAVGIFDPIVATLQVRA